MKHVSRLSISLVLALVLALSSVGTLGCSSDGSETAEPAATSQKEEDVVLTDDDVTEFDADAPEAEDDADDADDSDTDADDDADDADDDGPTQHVGAVGVGFVDIPASWTEFTDAEGGDDLQWCDGTPYTIVTLNVVDLSGMSADERAEFTTEVALNNIANHLLEEGIDEESLTGARVELADRDAVQLYGTYPSGSILVVWLVEDDAGNYRYVAAEGTTDTIMDAVEIVEDTYAL